MKCTFEVLGYCVVPVADATAAAEAFRFQPKIDVLLTDYEMPGKSGVELARELTLFQPLLPVVLYTASQLSDDILEEIRTRGWECIRKPGAIFLLDSTLQRVLNRNTH